MFLVRSAHRLIDGAGSRAVVSAGVNACGNGVSRWSAGFSDWLGRACETYSFDGVFCGLRLVEMAEKQVLKWLLIWFVVYLRLGKAGLVHQTQAI